MQHTHTQPLTSTSLPEDASIKSQAKMPEITHPEDSAWDVFYNFAQHSPPTIASQSNIDTAQQQMAGSLLHLLLVTDTKGQILGMVGSDDVIGEKPIRLTHEKKISRNDITVNMVMIPKNQVVCFKKSEVKFAKVWEVLESLRHLQQHHALVLDDEKDPQQPAVIGFFSAIYIGKLLDTNVTTDISIAHSISELSDVRKE